MPIGDFGTSPKTNIDQPVMEVLESISDAFFGLDRSWRFTYLNRAAERLLRRTRQELLSRPIWDEFPEAVGTVFDREYQKAVDQQVTVQFEEYFPPLETWFAVRAYPTPTGLSVYFQDINDLRRMQEDLRSSDDRNQAMFETMPQGVVFQDKQGRIEYANPAASRILGLSPEQLRGMQSVDPAWRTIHEDGLNFPGTDHPAMVALRTGKPVRDVVMGLFDPTRTAFRWLLINATPLFHDQADQAHLVYTVFEDITERKQWGEVLRRDEQRYRSLVDATSSIVWTTNSEGRVVEPMPSWKAFTGQTFAEYKEWGWLEAIHPQDRANTTKVWSQSVAEKSMYQTEYRIRRRDGEYRQVIARAVPILHPDGNVREWVGTCDDVTGFRQTEARLRQAKEEAERANRVKDEFISVLSHELRTPLTPVLLTISILEAHPQFPAEFLDDLKLIRRNVELESRLIGDLLDLTRLSTAKVKLGLEPVDVHASLRMAIDVCQTEQPVPMVVDLEAARAFVQGDPTRLQQIFWNLINNAQKFSEPGGLILIRTTNLEDGSIRVEVADRGIGINAEVLPRIFDAFEQGDIRAGRSFAGLGLGLAITRKLVEAHGGTIHASSPGKGQGSTFLVDLKTSERLDQLVPPAPPRPSIVPPGSSISVLLVEDHEDTQRLLIRLLSRMGLQVASASSVSSALAACEKAEFDLILSDLGLPDGSGLELMRQIKGRYQGRAVALTGFGTDSDIIACHEAGFAEHLTKPVDLATLQATIHRLVSTTDRPGS